MDFKKDNKILKTSISEDGIFFLTLNDPHNHNALSEEMMINIQSALDESVTVSYTHLTLPTICSV